MDKIISTITAGEVSLGIEFGSTRIKSVLVGKDSSVIAVGGHEWENQLIDGVWTYSLEDVVAGMQASYASLAQEVKGKYGVEITKLAGLGISGMMHGYMAFDKDGEQLVPFRTWRNTMTSQAAEELTELFRFNIPQRWSVAHFYQSILNNEEHIDKVASLTTLAGYIHKLLCGKNVLGVGEASGMFPIDSNTCNYDENMLKLFDERLAQMGLSYKSAELFPKVLNAGEVAGKLSDNGAKLLDPTGKLEGGAVMCPPEGDAGTGMVATNSVAKRTGNVSAGTSVFAMIVLEKALSQLYTEIDMVTTPTGKPVAMVHCNNCTSDLNAWADLLSQFSKASGGNLGKWEALDVMFNAVFEGDNDCGGLMAYNYLSGEHTVGCEEGRPLFMRTPDANFSFANFARTHVYSAICTLKIGMDKLIKNENVQVDKLLGHGGFFKSKATGIRTMAAAMNTRVTVMETAGEGGAWGMAILALYCVNKADGQMLEEFLDSTVFANCESSTAEPDKGDVDGFNEYAKKYLQAIEVEKVAAKAF